MKPELSLYEVRPSIFLEAYPSPVCIRAITPHSAFTEDEYIITVCQMEEESYAQTMKPLPKYSVRPENNRLCFTHTFSGEQEHLLHIATTQNPEKPFATVSVYSLKEDLFCRRPLVGNFHSHTTGSDGKQSPAYSAAIFRELGFDFTTIADHYVYDSSVEAINDFKNLPTQFRIYPGEEVHSPGNRYHIVNFGGDFSVNKLCYERPHVKYHFAREKMGIRQSWLDEVAARTVTEGLPQDVDPFLCASCRLIMDKIREGGGMAILAHPHLRDNALHVYNIPENFTKLFLKEKWADCLEIQNFSSIVPGQNLYTSQAALCYDLALEGIFPPIVGGNDVHDALHEHARCFRTIVFAKDNTRDDIIEAVKNHYSVAVEEFTGEHIHIYLSGRLVKYALFLHQWVFPLLAPLYEIEGRLLRACLAEDPTAFTELERQSGAVERLKESFFASK